MKARLESVAAAPISAKRLTLGLDDLDEMCQRAIDRAHTAYDVATRRGTPAAIEGARDAVQAAWATLAVAKQVSVDPCADPGDACGAGILALDEGRRLFVLQRALRRLEQDSRR